MDQKTICRGYLVHYLEFITGDLVQVKDEYYKMLCLERVGMQRRWERGNAMPGRAPAFGKHAEIAQRDPVSARTAWKKSTARCYSYVRLKQLMRILGVDPREQLLVLNWLRWQSRLEWSHMMYHPWELLHLELIMKRWKEGAEERGRRQEKQPQG
ncbi:hypothetical protein F5883DRAFT_515554 [Diaporthe sp. PMI_573]|nr:hypothetical protein F5883DRAFT_515554 [Diaporthaceae sp. PMI_573]